VVLIDPPYADTKALDEALALLASTEGVLAPDAWVVAKHFWRTPPNVDAGLLASVRVKRFGETALTLYRLPGHAAEAPAEGGDADEDDAGGTGDDE
jgi:16S rRNA G966 N2-methylase RsmD